MFSPLKRAFETIVSDGQLVVWDSSGTRHEFGDKSEPAVAVRLTDRRFERWLAFDPQMALGEGYISGQLIIESGTLYDFLDILLRNLEKTPLPGWMRSLDIVRHSYRRLQQFNPISRSRSNVAFHYDLDGAIYDLFLDGDRQYSCAYFDGAMTLDEAQLAKKRHIAAKLALKPDHRVLDIGSGWGGLALYMAEVTGADVTGITLSSEQLQVSRERAVQASAQDRVRFLMADYRQLHGTFDRIVSVGMFEHVGTNHYAAYFKKIHQLLADDGVALVHSIGRFDQPASTNPFIAKYIFPGGYIPSLSEVLPSVERSGLLNCDVEILRLHYAMTLREWWNRVQANRDKLKTLMGERFVRIWEFYLAASETAFRYQGLMVFQIQLAKRLETLPLTRDYMVEEERRLRWLERHSASHRKSAA